MLEIINFSHKFSHILISIFYQLKYVKLAEIYGLQGEYYADL